MSAVTITDRDLIAGAAKAIGLHWSRYDLAKLLHYGHSITADMLWNPITNRAHALQLAVDLSLFDGLDRKASEIAAAVDFDMAPIDATCRAITVLAYERSGGAA